MSVMKLRAGTAASEPFSIRTRLLFGSLLMTFLVFGCGGWAATAPLAGAVVAQGTVAIDRHVKKVQHMYSGIVAAINVKEGQKVEAGDTLIRIDDTQTRAELAIVRSQLIEMTGRKARLMAERDGLSAIVFPNDFLAMGPEAQPVQIGEIRLFDEARKQRQSQRDQLKERVAQLREEISGLSGQRDAKAKEMVILKKEKQSVDMLVQKQLTTIARAYSMERDETRLGGDHGSLIAQIARANGQISELNVQLLAIDQNLRAESQKELRAAEARLAEVAERYIAGQDRLTRLDLKAPQAGMVHQLSVHTVGGVINAAEPVMLIVPDNEDLVVEARINPIDRDQVRIGQEARLRFTAFNQRVTPEVFGKVMHIPNEVTQDPKTGQNYYVGRISIDHATREKLGKNDIIAGMPVDVYIVTGYRTMLSYLTKPVFDQFHRGLRER